MLPCCGPQGSVSVPGHNRILMLHESFQVHEALRATPLALRPLQSPMQVDRSAPTPLKDPEPRVTFPQCQNRLLQFLLGRKKVRIQDLVELRLLRLDPAQTTLTLAERSRSTRSTKSIMTKV